MISKHVKLSNGEIQLWIEQEDSICIKAVTDFGDPVELSIDEALLLINELTKMVSLYERENEEKGPRRDI